MGCRDMPETAIKWRKWGYWRGRMELPLGARKERKWGEGRGCREMPQAAGKGQKRGDGRGAPILLCRLWSSKLPYPQQVPEHHQFPYIPHSRNTILFSGSKRGSPEGLSFRKTLCCFSGSNCNFARFCKLPAVDINTTAHSLRRLADPPGLIATPLVFANY